MADKRARADLLIAELAARQHGAVTSQQLREAGLSRDAVLARRRGGRLHPLHRGVYAVGHVAPCAKRRWMAAVLALGAGAALSHRSAAALWDLLPPIDGPVDVSWPRRGGKRRRAGLRIHRPVSLEAHEMTRWLRIPVTSPARTIADLRAVASEPTVRRATRQAEALGLPTGLEVESDRTRSELERRFLRLCHRHSLPRPAVNMRIEDFTVDFCWLETRLVVETDGYRYHRGRQSFEDDRSRDLRLRGLGFEVLRLSHHQVFEEPRLVADVLRGLLMPPGHVGRRIPDKRAPRG